MSLQNFSILACLEVAEKFVMVRGWVVVSRPDLGFTLCQAKQKFSHIQLEKNRGKFSLLSNANARFLKDGRKI